MEFLEHLSYAKSHDGLTIEKIKYLEQLFRKSTNEDEIRLEDFRKIVKSKNNFFSERIFNVFDRDGSGTVSLQEFIDAISKFAGPNQDDKISFLFRIYDIDGNGCIQHSELHHVMKACMEENGMKFSEEKIEELTTILFKDADPTGSGVITFEALKAQLAKHEGLLDNLCASIARMLIPPKPEHHSLITRLKSIKPYWMSWRYCRNNSVYIIFLLFYVGVNIALFASRAYQFREENGFVVVARACGQCLNFTSMMLVVFMLRSSITWLRTNGFSSYLPLDDHIFFHKLTGIMVFVYSVVHTIMHLCNFNELVRLSNITNQNLTTIDPNETVTKQTNIRLTMVECLFTTTLKFGLVEGWASITGDLLIIIIIIIMFCSMPCVRQGGYFEVFYWTHQLYVAFWILLILHGPSFWIWFLGPATIYAFEKLFRQIRLGSGHGKTVITHGVLLPSKVTHLVIRRSPNFVYSPGDFIFIRIPAIARAEWHPFTISSAPEQEDSLWLHIRAAGQWSKKLHDFIEKQTQSENNTVISISATKECDGKGIPENLSPSNNSNEINCKTALLSEESQMNSNDDDAGDEKDGVDEKAVLLVSSKTSLPSLRSPSPTGSTTSDTKVTDLATPVGYKPLISAYSMSEIETRKKKKEKRLRFRKIPDNDDGPSEGFNYTSHKLDKPETDKPETGQTASPLTVKKETERRKSLFIRSFSSSFTTSEKEGLLPMPVEVYIDGPFGAPSSHIFRAQHAVLIATGIGVTPFASILQSVMRRYWQEKHTCPRCNYKWTGAVPQSIMNLRKVDFIWINRDQRCFEWFVTLLSRLEIEQAVLGGAMERFLDMHMYITSALQKNDMKALGLQLALDLLHEKENRDLITGLKTRTQPGRPNWDTIFEQIKEERKGKVTVFFCGSPELGRILQIECDKYDFTFRKEVF